MMRASPPSCPERARAADGQRHGRAAALVSLIGTFVSLIGAIGLLNGSACRGSEPAAAQAGAGASAPPSGAATGGTAQTLVPAALEPRAAGSGSAVAAPPGSTPAASASRPAASASACRAVTVSGTATRAGQPLRSGDELSGGLVELAADARLHLVHAASARAWSLEGPARLLACEAAAEEIVLARGTLRAEPGSGVRPGAEVWVGTPFGAVRYADAAATLSVGEHQLAVRVASGRLWFTPFGGSALDERALAASASFAAVPYRLVGAPALERCSRDAAAAEARARDVLTTSSRPLGERAAEHVRARQRARASCASARAAALLAPTEDPGASAALARSDALWRGVPEPGAGPRPP